MKHITRLSRGIAAGASGSALFWMMGTTDVRAADESANTSVIAEIVVTAQKRSENLQDVPASVSVFSDEQLTRMHATQLMDFAAYMPGVTITSSGGPGQTTITLRGIAPVGPGSVVGTYIDDTPLGSSGNYARATVFALDMMPYDVERVEVLRGPQGTLYGAGSMGGLLKYVLRNPDTEKLSWQAGLEGSDVSGAGDPGWGVRAAVNVPLADTVAVRASFFTQTTPGYIDNLSTGEDDENEVEQTGGRASLIWQPNDDLSLKLAGTWQRIDSDNNGAASLSLVSVNPPRARRELGEFETSHPLDQPFQKDVDYYSATLNWSLGWGEFVSASSYSTTHTAQQQDASITFGSLFPFLSSLLFPDLEPLEPGLSEFSIALDLDKWTQEFRLASSGDDQLEWRVGVFYTEEDSDNKQLVTSSDLQGQPIPIFLPYLADISLPTHYEEFAAFGDVTFKFNESFDISTGLRWATNKQNFQQISSGLLVPTVNILGKSDEDVLTYSVTPRWHVNDATMAYLRVATGYRPGGPNFALPGVPPQVDADELTNYEAGLKTQFMDNRALLNVALFYIDWEGIQQTRGFGGVSALTNAGDAKSQGVEVESLFALTNAFRLGVNLAYTDATLETSPPDLNNALGERLPGVPEWGGSLTADYSFTAFGGRDAHVGAGWRYVGERLSEVVRAQQNLAIDLPSYDIIDLNADVKFDAVTFRLFVRNLTDELAYTGGGATVDGLDAPVRFDFNVLQPRTIGVSVDVEF